MVLNTFTYYLVILFCILDEKHKYICWKYNALYTKHPIFYLLLTYALQYNYKTILYKKRNYSNYTNN